MITWSETKHTGGSEPYRVGACKSTDTKPTEGVANGSILMEIDTGKVWIFDGEDGQWAVFG